MLATQLLGAAFGTALSSLPDLHRRWISASQRLAAWAPASLLFVSVQRVGRLDMLLRTMETERLSMGAESADDVVFLATENQMMLSEMWLCALYEIVRSLNEWKVDAWDDRARVLFTDLTLVRIPLAKYQIARDDNLKEPLEFERFPAQDGDTPSFYDRDDRRRTHIMPTSLSARGAVMWHAIDSRKKEARWIERLVLSDAFLDWVDSAMPTIEPSADGGTAGRSV